MRYILILTHIHAYIRYIHTYTYIRYIHTYTYIHTYIHTYLHSGLGPHHAVIQAAESSAKPPGRGDI